MRITPLLFLLLSLPLIAAEPKVLRDMAYAEPKNERQTLDVYSPPEGKDRPIIFWIHGGGWKRGDKKEVQKKPQIFVDKGFVFVATNYRFVPNVTVKEMMGDIAKAIRFVHDHASDYGGDPKSIIVMGHSSGAHLAALVCTDESYLKAEKLSFSILKGCVPVDVSAYDIPKLLKASGSVPPETYKAIFTDKEETQREFSPVSYVAKGKDIPSFLILHVADRADTKAQSQLFAEHLKTAGVSAKVVAAEGKTHGTINSDLGKPDDVPTKALFEFLERVQKPRTLEFFKTKLDKTLTPAKAEIVFGKADRNIGSGLIIYEYDLDDGSKVRLSFPGFAPIVTARHVAKDGKTEELPLK